MTAFVLRMMNAKGKLEVKDREGRWSGLNHDGNISVRYLSSLIPSSHRIVGDKSTRYLHTVSAVASGSI